uniref:Uncharacterized protein n=1 Tax=viral metagenome TaxID=1070528 RepID=A0A6C0B1D6_9ZZZZ
MGTGILAYWGLLFLLSFLFFLAVEFSGVTSKLTALMRTVLNALVVLAVTYAMVLLQQL